MDTFYKYLKHNSLCDRFSRKTTVVPQPAPGNGHTVCDCSKMLKALAGRCDHERNPKTDKQFGGYTWCGDTTEIRRQRTRPPPVILNLKWGEMSLTIDRAE